MRLFKGKLKTDHKVKHKCSSNKNGETENEEN